MLESMLHYMNKIYLMEEKIVLMCNVVVFLIFPNCFRPKFKTLLPIIRSFCSLEIEIENGAGPTPHGSAASRLIVPSPFPV